MERASERSPPPPPPNLGGSPWLSGSGPVTARPQGPFSMTPATGARAPLARGAARRGSASSPCKSQKCPPDLFKYAEEEFAVKLCQAVTWLPPPNHTGGGGHQERSLCTWDKANSGPVNHFGSFFFF